MEEDYMINAIKEWIKETNGVMTPDEVTQTMHFFATFSIGCRKVGLDDLSDLYSKRLNYFVYLATKMGYKYGKRFSGSKTPGLQTIFSKSFYNLRIF